MEFRVLGPLEILDDSGGVVHVRAAKERSLLLSLLLVGRNGDPDVRFAATATRQAVEKAERTEPG